MVDNAGGDQAFNKKEVYGRTAEMTYGGALSFLRRKYSRDLDEIDVVVSGVPYDCATTYRPGARLGPRAIRAASVQLAELEGAFPFGFDPFAHLAVIDYGDCMIDPHYPESVVDTIEAHISNLLQAQVNTVTFGGDHFITYPILKAHAHQHGPVALLHFDAHCDTWPDDGKRLDHGSMFRRAKDEGLIEVSKSIQVGIRTYNDSDCGFEILTSPWVHDHGLKNTLDAIHRRVGEHKVYLTFDIDCIDPAFAPGTGTPVVGGLSTAQALTLMRGLGALNLVGMDVVEVAPVYDVAEITALAAANIAHDYLCLLAMKKGAKYKPIGRI